MPRRIKLKIITPERVVVEEEVDSVTLPAAAGEITVLPNHIPLVSTLTTGVITLRKSGEEKYIASSGGFLEVKPGSEVTVLADTADRADELLWEKVEAAKKAAEEAVEEARRGDRESYAAAVGILERELARLRAVTRHRRREKQKR